MTSHKHRILIKNSPHSTFITDLHHNTLTNASGIFGPHLVFLTHSKFYSKTNGPWSHYTASKSLRHRGLGGSPWHFTIKPARSTSNNYGFPRDRTSPDFKPVGQNCGLPPFKPIFVRRLSNRWALFTAIHEGIGALHRVSVSHLTVQRGTQIVTRYAEGVPRRYAFGSIEALGEVVRKRLSNENNRRLKVFIYDRSEELNTHSPRIWKNAKDTITELQNRFQNVIEIEYLQRMPVQLSEQSRVFTADVVISPHGGHMGNLIFSTNTLILESATQREWYWWMSAAFGHVFVHLKSTLVSPLNSLNHAIEPRVIVWYIERLLGYPLDHEVTNEEMMMGLRMTGNETLVRTSCGMMRSDGLVQDVPYVNFRLQ
uniref:Glycosyltransferase 61 catalytic domain-containing protein n=1 Tax=Timspurckia oligopyrenoides TaxID=708627 RepID=A0A7S0ZB13_9RHOD|mmetsp:Transcript_10747/g.19427  ORF Transcript_10747/g.19427 Transcript_10747/m.19427 type:complete len:370 (+) Transcript_10747:1-1110(+)